METERLCRQLPLVANRREEINGSGIVLGAVVDRYGQFLVHSRTEEFSYVVKGVVDILINLGLLPRSFGFTSFQFLLNAEVRKHKDKNISESLIFSFGSFDGGQFCTDAGVIDIYRNPTLFTGDILHWVQDIEGDRCSVALYCHKRSQELSSDMAKVLTSSGFVLPAALTPSEECPALRRDDLGDSRAVTLIEIGVHGLSAREFVSKHTKSAAFLHFNADVMKNVSATFPETAVFDLNSQMHAFAEWALAVSSSKWIIFLTMVGIQ